MKKLLLISFCLGLLLLAGQTAWAVDDDCNLPNFCTEASECSSEADQITTANNYCNENPPTTGPAKPICCKPKCPPENCKKRCTPLAIDTTFRAASCGADKECCKVGSGTKTPVGGTTQGDTIPLAPLSPVGDINVQTLIGLIIKGVLGIVGSIALLMFVYGGFLMLVSQGDPGKIKKGKDTLIWAAAGLVVIFGSYIFVSFILAGLSGGGA